MPTSRPVPRPPSAWALLLGAGFGACSDYTIGDKTGPNPIGDDTGAPEVRVDPAALELVGVCGAADQQLIVTNVGAAPLRVQAARAEGTGFNVDTSPLPADLDPGSSLELPVTVGVGEGRFLVDTDDPVRPTVEVPARAEADAPPTITLQSPAADAILPPGAVTVTATVADAETPPEALTLVWESDVDGVFSTASADASGAAAAPWPAPRASGPHLLRVTATDACGGSATAELPVCQDAGYTVDELDLASWHFEGNAIWDSTNGWVQLTDTGEYQVGTAFAVDRTVRGDNVQIRFAFFIGGGTGADGISLTAIDTSRMTTYLGGAGCGIGYGGDAACTAGPALPGWSIEVDTHHNAGQDPTEADHLAFTFDGDVDSMSAWVALPEMEDTGWHELVIDVAAPRVVVQIDGVTYIDQDIPGHYDFDAHVGFTAGTGGLTNLHLIDALQVTESVCGG